MLRKTPITTIIPGVSGQAYKAASYTCTPKPPAGTGGDTAPPPGSSTPSEYHVFVPNDPNNEAAGETYVVQATHPGTGYTCALQDPSSFITVRGANGFPITIQNSVVCTWSYP